MSYATMDHAEWMENQHRSENRQNERRRGYVAKPEELTDFQRKVCDILGMAGGGIYNAPIDHAKTDWDYGYGGVSVLWKQSVATWDFNELTMLVFLCHEARIRFEIRPAGPKLLRFSFWQRVNEGGMAKCHPSLSEAMARFRAYLPVGHRVRWTPAEEASADVTTCENCGKPIEGRVFVTSDDVPLHEECFRGCFGDDAFNRSFPADGQN